MNYITLILFNIVFFICNFYPKHILEINSALYIISIAFNIIFYFAFFWFLSIAFKRNKTLFSDNLFSLLETLPERLSIKPILTLLITQMFFDAAYIILCQTVSQYCIYFADIFILAQWIIIYCVFTRKQKNIFNNKKFTVITSVVLMIVLIASIYGDVLINRSFVECNNKYSANPSWLLTASKNLEFIFQLKSLLFDSLIGITLLLFHSLSPQEKPKAEDKKFIKTIIRFSTCIFAALLLIFFKTLIMPYSSITGYNVKGDKTTVYQDKNNFYANTEILTIRRGHEIVFQITKNQIFYNKTLLKEFATIDGKSASNRKIEGNIATIIDCFEDETINGVEVEIYKDMAVCYVKDGNPTVMLYDKKTDLNNIIN